MSNELDSAIAALREAAPHLTDVAVQYALVSSVTNVVGGVLAVTAGAILCQIGSKVRDSVLDAVSAEGAAVVFAGFFVTLVGFIVTMCNLPGVFVPEGAVLFGILR